MADLINNKRCILKEYITSSKNKVVEWFDLTNNSVKYSNDLKKHREISELCKKEDKGQIISEEMTRAYIITKLCNELGYKSDRIELEKSYVAGRPHTMNSRIDIIVKDKNDNAYMFIELKSPTANY